MGDVANYGVTMPQDRPLETFHSNAPGFVPPVVQPLPSGAESGAIESTGHIDHDPQAPCPGPGPCPLNPTPQPGPIPDAPADYTGWIVGGISLLVGLLIFVTVFAAGAVVIARQNAEPTED